MQELGKISLTECLLRDHDTVGCQKSEYQFTRVRRRKDLRFEDCMGYPAKERNIYLVHGFTGISVHHSREGWLLW